MTITQTIRNLIERTAFGELLTAKQLLELGSRDAIDQALARLCRAGLIVRITRGVYTKPRASRFGGLVLPEPNALAQAFAKLRGITLQLQGAEAVRRFGLSTQMPAQLGFQTDGRTRTLHLGKLEIRLHHAPAKMLLLAGSLAGQALSALRYLGRKNINPQQVKTILEQLPTLERQRLQENLFHLPRWLAQPLMAALP
jgi:predicted transcriptional regulator of viral defense system